MKKQLLCLSILLLAPGFVVASETASTKDAELKEHCDAEQTILQTQLQMYKTHSAALLKATGNLAAAQASVNHHQPKLEQITTSIEAALATKSKERASLNTKLAALETHPQRDSNLGPIDSLKANIKRLDKEISDGYAQIGKQEPADGWWGKLGWTKPKAEEKSTQKKAEEPPIKVFEDGSCINAHGDTINADGSKQITYVLASEGQQSSLTSGDGEIEVNL